MKEKPWGQYGDLRGQGEVSGDRQGVGLVGNPSTC